MPESTKRVRVKKRQEAGTNTSVNRLQIRAITGVCSPTWGADVNVQSHIGVSGMGGSAENASIMSPDSSRFFSATEQ